MANTPNQGVIQITSDVPGFVGFAASRIGGRAENQDTVAYTDTPLGLLVLVCDGMGGGPGGKTASVIAATTIGNYMSTQAAAKEPDVALTEAINAANDAILQYAASHNGFRGMGSTVAALLINDHCAYAAHIGDSRIYQMRGKSVVYRSTDHSKVMELVVKKIITEEQARTSGESNIITQALGHGQTMKPEITRLPFLKNDRFALCSDGIWGMFPQKKIVEMFTESPTPAGAVDASVIEVDAQGQLNGNHHDNLTLAIVDTQINSKLKVPMTKTSKIIFAALAAVAVISIILNIILLTVGSSQPDQQQNQAAEQTINDLKQKVSELEKQNVQLKARKELAEQQATDAKNNQEQAKAQNDAMKSQLDDVVSRLEKIEASIRSINAAKSVAEKRKIAQKAVNDLTEIEKNIKDEKAKQNIDKTIAELKKPQTVKNDSKGKGQVNAIANILSTTIKSLKTK